MKKDLLDFAGWQRPEAEPTQIEICRECKGSQFDRDMAYCHRFDLALEVDKEEKVMRLSNGNYVLTCNGEKWTY